MKKNSRIFALLLALLMLSQAAACSQSGTNGDETKGNDNNPSESTNENDGASSSDEETETETERIKPDIPETADYAGDEIRFMSWNISFWEDGAWKNRDIYAEGLTGEGINDAVYKRNQKIETNYKVKIALDIQEFSDIVGMVTKAGQSGDDTYDVVYPRLVEATTLFNNGSLINIHRIPNIDLSKPWWDSNCNDALTVEGYLPCIATSINIQDKDATAAMIFSKVDQEKYGIEDLYQVVREGKWTIDKVIEIADATDDDLDGNGEMTPDDHFGFIGARDVMESFYYGSGEQHATKDESGTLGFSFGTERDFDICTKIVDMMNQPYFVNSHTWDSSKFTDSMRTLFSQGAGTFLWIRLADVTTLRECDIDFGVLPIPKYEESQSDYYSMVSRHSTGLMTVPISVKGDKLDELGVVLEALAAESHYTLIPEYIETSLKTKHSRDAESGEMIDIVISNRVYDPIYIYNISSFSDDFLVLGDTDNPNLATLAKSKSKMIGKQLDKLSKTFAGYVEAGN